MKDIEKTIEKIEDALEENALPKAAPTQFAVDCPPRRMGEDYIEVRCVKCDFRCPKLLKEVTAMLAVDPDHEAYNASAKEHCEETGHTVDFILHIGEMQVVRRFMQPKPSFLDRVIGFYQKWEFAICVMFLSWCIYNVWGGTTGWIKWVWYFNTLMWTYLLGRSLWWKWRGRIDEKTEN